MGSSCCSNQEAPQKLLSSSRSVQITPRKKHQEQEDVAIELESPEIGSKYTQKQLVVNNKCTLDQYHLSRMTDQTADVKYQDPAKLNTLNSQSKCFNPRVEVFDQMSKKRQSLESYYPSDCQRINVSQFVNFRMGKISDDYFIGQIVGEGGFGTIRKIVQKNTGTIRAVKQIKLQSLVLEDQQRMLSEITLLKTLDHPNIVKVFEFYSDDKNYYIITEFLQGGELFDRIKQMTYFSEKKAAEYLNQIIRAVAHCHDKKIVHRDLKPDNILLCDKSNQSSLKLIDFGISRRYDLNKSMTKKQGTPYYMAPEVLLGDYTEKCDIWSCGVILYVMLCGYPPFRGKNEQEIFTSIRCEPVNLQTREWCLISKEAKRLVMRMLDRNQQTRISAKEILQDPWLIKNQVENCLDQTIMLNLQKFQAQTFFRKAMIAYITNSTITQMEIDELAKTFIKLDLNNDGTLDKEELAKGYLKQSSNIDLVREKVDNILKYTDIDFSGQVDFSEFAMAALSLEKLVSLDRIKKAFRFLDQSSRITTGIYNERNSNRQWVKSGRVQYLKIVWNSIVEECDYNSDGVIQEDEFIKVLQSLSHSQL